MSIFKEDLVHHEIKSIPLTRESMRLVETVSGSDFYSNLDKLGTTHGQKVKSLIIVLASDGNINSNNYGFLASFVGTDYKNPILNAIYESLPERSFKIIVLGEEGDFGEIYAVVPKGEPDGG